MEEYPEGDQPGKVDALDTGSQEDTDNKNGDRLGYSTSTHHSCCSR